MIDYARPWHVLDIDTTNALNPQFDPYKLRAESTQADAPVSLWKIHGNEVYSVFNKDWLEQLEARGISMSSAMLFYRDAYHVHPVIHIDVFKDGTPCIYAFNWVISPVDNSPMVWYDIEIGTGEVTENVASTKYQYWSMEEYQHTEVARKIIGNELTMVKIGMPHTIIVNEHPRWLMSIRCTFNENIKDWNSAVDYYSHLFKRVD